MPRKACGEAATWPDKIKVAVNVSPTQFRSTGFPLKVLAALHGSGLSPHRLELEITEAVLIKDDELALTILHEIRTIGVRIALDDFGTSYSSFSYLQRFPFDKIKIDRSFINGLSEQGGASIDDDAAPDGLHARQLEERQDDPRALRADQLKFSSGRKDPLRGDLGPANGPAVVVGQPLEEARPGRQADPRSGARAVTTARSERDDRSWTLMAASGRRPRSRPYRVQAALDFGCIMSINPNAHWSPRSTTCVGCRHGAARVAGRRIAC